MYKVCMVHFFIQNVGFHIILKKNIYDVALLIGIILQNFLSTALNNKQS